MPVLKRSIGPVDAGETVEIGARHPQDFHPEWGNLCELIYPGYSDPIAFVHEISLPSYLDEGHATPTEPAL